MKKKDLKMSTGRSGMPLEILRDIIRFVIADTKKESKAARRNAMKLIPRKKP